MFFSSGIAPRHSMMAIVTPWIDIRTQIHNWILNCFLKYFAYKSILDISKSCFEGSEQVKFFDMDSIGIDIIIQRSIACTNMPLDPILSICFRYIIDISSLYDQHIITVFFQHHVTLISYYKTLVSQYQNSKLTWNIF